MSRQRRGPLRAHTVATTRLCIARSASTACRPQWDQKKSREVAGGVKDHEPALDVKVDAGEVIGQRRLERLLPGSWIEDGSVAVHLAEGRLGGVAHVPPARRLARLHVIGRRLRVREQ
jgi:hypothetical protein